MKRVSFINNKIAAGDYSAGELYNRTNELKYIDERVEKLKEKYKLASAQE